MKFSLTNWGLKLLKPPGIFLNNSLTHFFWGGSCWVHEFGQCLVGKKIRSRRVLRQKKNHFSIWYCSPTLHRNRKLKMDAKNWRVICRWCFHFQPDMCKFHWKVFLESVQIHVYPQKCGITKKFELRLHGNFWLKFQAFLKKAASRGALFCFKRCIDL